MTSIKILMAMMLLLSFSVCSAQFKHEQIEIVKVYGNCGMCKSTIEKAGSVKNVAKVEWNKDTKMATLTYDATKTNQDEILKRIALAGYDSDSFLAPDDVYAKLHGCCQYDRVNKTAAAAETGAGDDHAGHNHGDMGKKADTAVQEADQLKAVFAHYFSLKDALVKTDGAQASAKAKEMLAAIQAVKMEALSAEQQAVWGQIMKDVAFDTEHIEETKDAGHQRDHFITLSSRLYQLLKVSKQETPIYYQHCPMANDGKGAHWLSKESAVKNPYYGSKMLACGKTVETIK